MSTHLPHWAVWLVLALVICVRASALQVLRNGLKQDPDGYVAVSTYLGAKNTFALQENSRGEPVPTAFRPPLYPYLLSWFDMQNVESRVFQVGVFQFLIGIGTVILVWQLGLRWQLSPTLALVAATLVGLDPILVQQSSQIMTETLATLLAVAALLSLTIATTRRTVWQFLAGGVLGLCILCRPTFAVWTALVVPLVVGIQASWKRRLLAVAGMSLGIALVVQPWVLRNYAQFGRPIVMTTHGGTALLRGNNALYFQHLKTKPFGTPWESAALDEQWERDLRQRNIQDELQADRFAYQLAWQEIANQPSMFAKAILVRLSRLYGVVPWQVDANETPRRRWLRFSIGAFYLVEFTLAFVGIVILGKRLLGPPWIWGTLLVLSFTFVHAFYWTDMRMRAPLVPVIALATAVGAGRVWNWVVDGRHVGSSRAL